MNDSRPANARREEAPAKKPSERTPDVGQDDERDLRWRIRVRLDAVLVELEPMNSRRLDLVDRALEDRLRGVPVDAGPSAERAGDA
jgi:hypothetical protein